MHSFCCWLTLPQRIPPNNTIRNNLHHQPQLPIPPRPRLRQKHHNAISPSNSQRTRIKRSPIKLVLLPHPLPFLFSAHNNTPHSRRDGSPFINLIMCSPIYDFKGVLLYFIGAQCDVTLLIEQGIRIKSFRPLLEGDAQRDSENIPIAELPSQKSSAQATKALEAQTRLSELSTMFSQDEEDIVKKNDRAAAEEVFFDTASIRSRFPGHVRNRGNVSERKVYIGFEKPVVGPSYNFAHLNLPPRINGSSNLPGVYKHVGSHFSISYSFTPCVLDTD
jgi:hypothetical protein